MIATMVFYLIMFGTEWIYLRHHQRKIRTFLITFGVMLVSLLCNLLLIGLGGA
ncbi:hypothetical protein [Paenibacillus sp. S150]|uniref:hypothetical protein n=1 Tax=Paenibacillus sp. S150 TaxID=2749826 RepID=UPI001C57AF18|nr:hypothetical protein [Paenibacillus sp. S150]MBW4083616.1 hypothetical protein [Paenibacillus sp. S150]